MSDLYFLERFVEAQEGIFDTALAELKAGRKQSHWMWFIFPQLAELGRSPTAKFYGIASLDEARAFLSHPLLGEHLREVGRSGNPVGGTADSRGDLRPGRCHEVSIEPHIVRSR
ncbi:MAG: DUF1810 domain-containing protein [Sphingomicrobium sp.]